jgi:hypothetical protein
MLNFEANQFSTMDLLRIYGSILTALRERAVVRSENSPTGDYAEWLASQKLHLRLQANSSLGFDATDLQGTRYQIKARRLTPRNPLPQLSAIRDIESRAFDYLIAILFDQHFEVTRVLKIPHHIVAEHSTFVARTNSSKLIVRGPVVEHPETEDITNVFTDANRIA